MADDSIPVRSRRAPPRALLASAVIVLVCVLGAVFWAERPRTTAYAVGQGTPDLTCTDAPPLSAAGFVWDASQDWPGREGRFLVSYRWFHAMRTTGVLVAPDGSRHPFVRAGKVSTLGCVPVRLPS